MSVTCSMAQPLLLSKISQGSCVPGQGGADHVWRQDTASTAPGAGEGKPLKELGWQQSRGCTALPGSFTSRPSRAERVGLLFVSLSEDLANGAEWISCKPNRKVILHFIIIFLEKDQENSMSGFRQKIIPAGKQMLSYKTRPWRLGQIFMK